MISPTRGAVRVSAWHRRALQAGYLAMVTTGLYLAFAHWAYDDPFITYRYAENLSRGLGLVYNPGERVLSTTSPLFALLLALLAFVPENIPLWANLISAASLAIGALSLFDLAKTWEMPLVGWTGLLLYPTFSLGLSTIGSETPLYLALCLGTFALYARGRYSWAGLVAALAVLARGDALLVPAILGLDYLLRVRRPIPWRAIGIFCAVLLPWVMAGWWYYGSPLPVTLAAKQGQGLMSISQKFAPGFLTVVGWYARSWLYRTEALLAVVGAGALAGRGRRWGLVLAWTALYFAAYTVLGVSRYYWYYAPLVPGFVILIGLGVNGLVHFIRGRAPRVKLHISSSGLAAIALLGTLQAVRLPDIRANNDERLPLYQAIGHWLNEHTPPEASVGLLEVGIIGFYADRAVIDFAGLLQPEVAGQFSPAATYDDTGLWAIERYRPDFLVLHDGGFPKMAAYAAEHCTLSHRFVGAEYDYGRDLIVFDCR